MQATANANPDRFQAPTWAEEAADNGEAQLQQLRHEHATEAAMTAMLTGQPGMVVDQHTSGKQTLADMLSEHTCNYLVDVPGNPCESLATLVATGLRSQCAGVRAAAEAYARRIALDYATTHEVL
jgi:hypothetical protein